MLGKVKSLDVQRTADLIIVDAPAAGHAITFLTSAQGLLDAVSVGPVRKQATDVIELLGDPERCQVLLVTIPEETPVSELVDTAFAIEDRTGVSLGPVVVNGCYEDRDRRRANGGTAPSTAGGTRHRGRRPARRRAARRVRVRPRGARPRARRRRSAPSGPAIQHHQADRLAQRLPLPQIRLPFLFTADLGLEEIERLADAFDAGVERAVSTRTVAEVVERGPRRRLLRQRWRRQDHERPRCSRSRARAGAGARSSSRSTRRSGSPTRSGSTSCRTSRARSRPTRWDPKGERIAGGALSAMMLDTKSTFDGLVTRYAPSPEQTQRILENSFYRNISSALSGTQEYMAMEKLHELHEEGGFDLIVVDTPPSRHALDFLDAPQRLLRLLDNRIFRLLMVPTRTGMRDRGRRGAGVPADDLAGRRLRGRRTTSSRSSARSRGWRKGSGSGPRRWSQLLGEPDDPLRAHHLAAARRGRGGAVLRREDRRPRPRGRRAHREPGASSVRHRARVGAAGPGGVAPRAAGERQGGRGGRATRLAAQYDNLADFNEIAERERSHLETVRVRVGSAAVAFVPYLAHDVYDFDALAAVGQLLFASCRRPGAARPGSRRVAFAAVEQAGVTS